MKLQSREKPMGLRAGDGQAFEWRRDMRNGEGMGHPCSSEQTWETRWLCLNI